MKKIIIDSFGADAGQEVILRGAAAALKQDPQLHLVLVGKQEEILPVMEAEGISADRYTLKHAEDVIGVEEQPACVFRGRENSSLVMALQLLKEDPDALALLSPGSTGALLVGSIVHLGLLPGLKQPALCSALPCSGREFLCLVDCGANVEAKPRDLVRFARMGDAFMKCLCGMENPRVGLMNVGTEPGKGDEKTKEVYQLLKEQPLNFIGNIEGSDMVSDVADVIVADGFVGNVLLKNTEAVGKAALALVEEQMKKAPSEALSALHKELLYRYDFNNRGGATFLGTKKTVIKMHGCATAQTVVACIDQALRLTDADFIGKLAQALEN
ncbi:MAG: phosphate acyltransferase PlsX [Oscillospiraceae bacterium]|nr:phosphate acyltransferase PlsX [Oscillospiraceae bacterium]